VSTDRDLVLVVIGAIAEVEDVAPHELGYTLHEHVSPEAIRGLAEGAYDGWELTFTVPDHEVTVEADAGVYVDGELIEDGDRSRRPG
jgi:hypothetical protein